MIVRRENKKIFMLNRWKYFKQYRQKHEQYREEIKSHRKLAKDWINIFALKIAMSSLFKKIDVRIQEKLKVWAKRLLANRLNYRFKMFAIKKGHNTQERSIDYIRHSFNFKCIMTHELNKHKAQEIIYLVLKDFKCKNTLYHACLKYWTQILKVRQRFIHMIMMKRMRMARLREIWEEEQAKLLEAYQLEYQNKRLKRTKIMIKALKNFRVDLRDMCLRLYLDKCRNEHNVAFFQWRENFSISAKELVDKYSLKLMRAIENDQKQITENDK